MAVKSKSPGHDTLDTAGLGKKVDLLSDELGSVPGPEDTVGGIPVPLPSIDLVGSAIVESLVE
jgi:hypothetical protein